MSFEQFQTEILAGRIGCDGRDELALATLDLIGNDGG
jgi:hypothetical protein